MSEDLHAVGIWAPQDDPDEHRGALRLEYSTIALDAAVLAGRVDRDWVFGGDFATNLWGAALRGEATYTKPKGGERYWQVVGSIDYTVGIGAELFFEVDEILDQSTGVVETEIDNLTDQNEFNEARIEEMRVRLEIERQDLLDRFLRMETALATANRILESIKQTTDAMFADNG